MADRQLIYTLENVTTVDHLNMQQNYYLALSRLMGELISSPAIGGFLCTPTVVPSLNVNVAAGEIYSQQVTDATDYGVAPNDIPANAALILKQGIYNGGTFSTPAPVTVGDSINYLIQIAFQTTDNVNQSRLFKVGGIQSVNTVRQDLAIVQIKTGVPAPTGTQVTPTPDVGFIGAWVITVAYGQTTVTALDIAQYPNAPFFGAAYNGAIQNMVQKPPYAGSATYLMKADLLAPQTVTGSAPLELQSNPIDDPRGWWNNTTFEFKPDIPCTVIFSAFSAATNISSLEYQLALPSPAKGQGTANFQGLTDASCSVSAIGNFSGANSIQLIASTNTGGVSISVVEAQLSAVVIVN